MHPEGLSLSAKFASYLRKFGLSAVSEYSGTWGISTFCDTLEYAYQKEQGKDKHGAHRA